MTEIMETINEFIKPELLSSIPVIYFIGMGIKKSEISDNLIPALLGIISVIICTIWVFSTTTISGYMDILAGMFTGITQGILVAGASIYLNQVIKQSREETDVAETDNVD